MKMKKGVSSRWGGLLVLAVLVGLPLCAGAKPSPKLPAADRLTRKEASEYFERLSKEGWSGEEFGLALKICKYSKPLLDIYISLYKQKVPPKIISHSFYTVKGAPHVAKEYWEYINKYKFRFDEVDTVFRTFPENKIVRWHYFAYRSGGLIDPNDKKTKRGKMYGRQECEAIFKQCRYDMNFIKKYFDMRNEGITPTEAFGAIREELVEKIRKEQEEKRKKKEEEMKKLLEKMAQHKAVLEESEAKPEESPEPDKKEDEYVVLSVEELGALLEVVDEKEPKEKNEEETKQGEGKGEKEGEKSEQGSAESEASPEEGKAQPEETGAEGE